MRQRRRPRTDATHGASSTEPPRLCSRRKQRLLRVLAPPCWRAEKGCTAGRLGLPDADDVETAFFSQQQLSLRRGASRCGSRSWELSVHPCSPPGAGVPCVAHVSGAPVLGRSRRRAAAAQGCRRRLVGRTLREIVSGDDRASGDFALRRRCK